MRTAALLRRPASSSSTCALPPAIPWPRSPPTAPHALRRLLNACGVSSGGALWPCLASARALVPNKISVRACNQGGRCRPPAPPPRQQQRSLVLRSSSCRRGGALPCPTRAPQRAPPLVWVRVPNTSSLRGGVRPQTRRLVCTRARLAAARRGRMRRYCCCLSRSLSSLVVSPTSSQPHGIYAWAVGLCRRARAVMPSRSHAAAAASRNAVRGDWSPAMGSRHAPNGNEQSCQRAESV